MSQQFACTFCGKTYGQVSLLLTGPRGVQVCDECIDLLYSIKQGSTKSESGSATDTIPLNQGEGAGATNEQHVEEQDSGSPGPM